MYKKLRGFYLCFSGAIVGMLLIFILFAKLHYIAYAYHYFVYGSEAPVVVKVKIVADESYIKLCKDFEWCGDWKASLRERIENSSQYFEKEFDVRLQVTDISIWQHQYRFVNKSAENRNVLFEILQNLSLGDGDVLVGVVGGNIGGKAQVSGEKTILGTHPALNEKSDYIGFIEDLDRHEFGHIFGLTHWGGEYECYGLRSSMYNVWNTNGFNEKEKAIISDNKYQFQLKGWPGKIYRRLLCVRGIIRPAMHFFVDVLF